MEPPFWEKWCDYVSFFSSLYKGVLNLTFTKEHPWTLFEVEELKIVIAGINSTMAESHREEDHYGLVGERQTDWFVDNLQPYKEAGWLRIGAVHHNLQRGATADDENLRDVATLGRLAPYLNCILHGHTHEAKTAWLNNLTPILSTGSAAINESGRAREIPNQYQLIKFRQGGFTRWTRQYAPARKEWIADTRVIDNGNDWCHEVRHSFEAVGAAFSELRARGGSHS